MASSTPYSRPSTPKTRDDLRRVLIRDQADREAISSLLMRYQAEDGGAGRTSSTCCRCTRTRGAE